MSVVSTTYACDWPGCKQTVEVRQGEHLGDRNWEGRGSFSHGESQWYACPEHRFKSTDEFRDAIEGRPVEADDVSLEEWGRVLLELCEKIQERYPALSRDVIVNSLNSGYRVDFNVHETLRRIREGR